MVLSPDDVREALLRLAPNEYLRPEQRRRLLPLLELVLRGEPLPAEEQAFLTNLSGHAKNRAAAWAKEQGLPVGAPGSRAVVQAQLLGAARARGRIAGADAGKEAVA